MGVIVTFDYAAWSARFPELASSVAEPQAQGYFDEATLYQANDGSGPVCNAVQQSALLNLLTAHIAKLYATLNGVPASGLVGRISDATEGSVSVSADMGAEAGAFQAWLQQTAYGASWWNATRQFRTFRYRPGYLSTRGL